MKEWARWVAPIVGAWCVLHNASASAQDASVLGRAEVIALARERAPDVRIAERRLGEARGELVGAAALVRENARIEFEAGPRFRQTDTIVDGSATLSIPLEIYGVRDAEIDAAQSGIERDFAAIDVARLGALRQSLVVYYRVLRADEEVRWTAAQRTLAEQWLVVAERRQSAGEIGEPEVAAARVLVAAARARAVRAFSDRTSWFALLRVELGLASNRSFDLAGTLADARAHYADALADTPMADSPSLAAAEHDVEAARARVRAEERRAWPVPVLRTSYQREENEDLVLFGLELPLPFFQNNQGAIAHSHAVVARLETEREVLEARTVAEQDAARARYRGALEALRTIEAQGLPSLEQSVQMLQRAYELGAIDLPSLLAVQRELGEAARVQLDALLELAEAGVELEVRTGVLR